MQFSEDVLRARITLAENFPLFAKALQVRRADGGQTAFVLNRPQQVMHAFFERQLKETGHVRIIGLKGRRMGFSTYVIARHYWNVTHRNGVKARLLAHSDDSAAELWDMLTLFHDSAPDLLRPVTDRQSAKELGFSDLRSSFKVASAAGRDVGRGAGLQYVHASEVAYYPGAKAAELLMGLLKAVPRPEAAEGETEIVLESTANGVGGPFYDQWKAAEAGETAFRPLFLPWWEHDIYQAPPPEGWTAPPAFREYQAAYGLTAAQLYWFFNENRDNAAMLGVSADEPNYFTIQEFPANAAEAFQAAGKSFIPARDVLAARARKKLGSGGPVVIGVDPAQSDMGSGDATGVVDRQGCVMGRRLCERWFETDTMVLVGRLAQMIGKYEPALVNVDVTGGLGRGVYDRLRELGYANVRPVIFGEKAVGVGPQPAAQYKNRRAEMWDTMRNWFSGQDGPVEMVEDDALHADVTAPIWGSSHTRYSSERVLTLEPKDKIRERLGRSPDMGDAAALTFASPTPNVALVGQMARHGWRDLEDTYDDGDPDPFGFHSR